MVTAIVGGVESAFFGFNHGIDAVGIGAGHRDAEMFPGCAAIRGAVQAATRSAAIIVKIQGCRCA
jgi:hypothetical protein